MVSDEITLQCAALSAEPVEAMVDEITTGIAIIEPMDVEIKKPKNITKAIVNEKKRKEVTPLRDFKEPKKELKKSPATPHPSSLKDTRVNQLRGPVAKVKKVEPKKIERKIEPRMEKPKILTLEQRIRIVQENLDGVMNTTNVIQSTLAALLESVNELKTQLK